MFEFETHFDDEKLRTENAWIFLDLLEASWICDVQHRSNKYEAFLDFDFFRSLYIRNDDERMTVWYYSLFRLVFFHNIVCLESCSMYNNRVNKFSML